MNTKCFILGHLEEYDQESPVTFCHRCKETMAEYDWPVDTLSRSLNIETTLRRWHFGLHWRLSGILRPYFDRCIYCGKLERIGKKRVGNHRLCDDIPF